MKESTLVPLQEWIPTEGFARPKVLIYGASGAGKTVFGSTADRVIFADLESGMASVKKHVGRWPVATPGDLGQLLTMLETENDPVNGFKTLVVDSLNELQRVINDYVLTLEPGAGKRSFGGQQLNIGDWGYGLTLMERAIRRMKMLDMTVIFLCSTAGVVGAEGKIEPALYGKNTVGMVTRYMDAVGYLHARRKGETGMERVLGFELPYAVSKDRSGLLPAEIINPTWNSLRSIWAPGVDAPLDSSTPPQSETAQTAYEHEQATEAELITVGSSAEGDV